MSYRDKLKIAHVTDLHFIPFTKVPQSRTEDFVTQITNKIVALKDCLQRDLVDLVVVSGDIFHIKASYNYIPEYVIYWQEQFEQLGIPILTIPGNHDLQKSSYDNLKKSAYYLFSKGSKFIEDISFKSNKYQVGNKQVSITGIPYFPLRDLLPLCSQCNEALDNSNYNIVLVHADAIPDNKIPLHWETISYEVLEKRIPKADLICLGHIHQSFPIYSYNNEETGKTQYISKPWSFSRVVRDYFTSTDVLEHQHKPSYNLITITDKSVEMEYKVIPHVPFEQAFEVKSLTKQIEESIKIQSFLTQVKEQYSSTENAFNIEDPREFLQQMEIPVEVRELIEGYLNK